MGRRRKKGNPVNGWINLDKPQGLTSTQAMAKVRYILQAQKAGHAGTLDPMATGILPIALGEATKVIPFCQDRAKSYDFTIKWGEKTDTDDAEGNITQTSDLRPDIDQIEAALERFRGDITQIPPQYSAIKIDGERAYDLARAGKNPEMNSRDVVVYDLQLLKADKDSADFSCQTSKGTYVRSLGRDIAESLGTVGHISVLRRTAVGPLTLKTSISLAKLEEIVHSAGVEAAVQDIQAVLDDIPVLDISDNEAQKLKNGQILDFVSRPDFKRIEDLNLGEFEDNIGLAMNDDKAVALIEIQGAKIKPKRILHI